MKKQVYIEIVSTQVGADGQKEILSSSVEGKGCASAQSAPFSKHSINTFGILDSQFVLT